MYTVICNKNQIVYYLAGNLDTENYRQREKVSCYDYASFGECANNSSRIIYVHNTAKKKFAEFVVAISQL